LPGVVIGINTGGLDLAKYSLFIFSSILFGLSYLSIAILISTIFKKRSTAMGATIFIWFFFAIIWGTIVFGVLALSGWDFASTHSVSEIKIYDDGITSFEIDGFGKDVAYGNGNIYILGSKIIQYNITSQITKEINIPSFSYVSIDYANGKIYLAGDEAMVYDIASKQWNTINISCNDISYCNGSIYLLNFFKLTEYGEEIGNISLPATCYSMACGEGKIFLSSEYQTLIEYDIKNQTFFNYSHPGINHIYDIAYGNGNIYILGKPSSVFNTTSKEFHKISISGDAIAYGDGKIITLDTKSKTELQQFPTWYYVSDFFNPVQIYRGIMALNIEYEIANFKELYPSFYNTVSLTLSLLIWIIAPLIVSIYIFKRKDV